MTEPNALAPRRRPIAAIAAVSCGLFGWYGVAFGPLQADEALALWFLAGIAAIFGARASDKASWERSAFVVAAIGNLGSLAFVAGVLLAGFSTVGH